ncbi:STB4 [Candida metapsilosis]|uniref:STB4 n=1 Tax=Candida metapsilosis TaxID=273372 RepID=A0A8H7ZE30_9ASCO|nr:STB4 [Candida metapsilosis]
MSDKNQNSELPRINLRDSRNPSSGMTPPNTGFSPYGTVQLPPVYSYRQSQQQQSQQQPHSGSDSTYSGSPNPIVQPLQPTVQSQPKQTADSRPRMRVSKACDRCRTHKIKCSGSDPCTTCVRQKKECTFSNPAAGGNVQNKSNGYQSEGADFNKKRKFSTLNSEPFGLPVVDKSNEKDYISHLENRVQYLENLLSRNTLEDFRQPRFQEPESEGVVETLFTTSSKWRFSRRHQNLLIVELCKSMYANLSEESKEKVTIPRMQYFGWNMSGVNYLTPENLPSLPELEVTLDERYLIDFFFKEVNPLFAIVHETVFREQYEAYDKLMKEEKAMTGEHKHDSKSNQTKLYSAILYLIFALAIRFSEFQKPKSPDLEMLKLEEKLFKYGYKIVSILSFEWESFELIQSWLLIALYLRVAHRQTSSSHALGQAITMTKSMGLGFSEENYNILSCTGYERLKAKRIFWCVFTFDRVFGLQTGRYCGIREEDFGRGFPGFDFQRETVKDDWLTLPALALLHIARISNFVHTAPTDNTHLIKYQQINAELVKLHHWFNEVGFRNDLLFNKHVSASDRNEVSSLVKAQVKLHYYDLVLCVHGKVLFNYIGRRIVSNGLKVEMVLDACHGVIEVLDKVNKAGLLYTPWYSVLLLLFNIGVNALCLINGGVFISQSRDLLKNTIKLFTILKKSPIRNKQNKLVFRERFKMVRECTWALKMANKILTLRLEEDMNALNNIGVDHGSSDVNKQYFSQLGFNDGALGASKDARTTKQNEKDSTKAKANEFNKVFEQQLYRNEDGSNVHHRIMSHREPIQRTNTESPVLHDTGIDNQTPQEGASDSGGTYVNSFNTPSSDNHEGGGGAGGGAAVDLYPSTEIDHMLSNLQWFDQWVDFTYDF